MGGRVAARGRVNGPPTALQPEINLTLDQPRFGVPHVPERWQGNLSGEFGRNARLAIAAQQPAVPGTLVAELAPDGWPKAVRLDRGEGQLRLDAQAPGVDQHRYRWSAADLNLDGLRFIVPPVSQPKAVAGQLTGAGSLAVAPLAVQGSVAISQPSLAGVAMKRLNVDGSLTDGRFQVDAAIMPLQGSINLKAQGDLGGRMHSAIQAEGLDVTWLTLLARQLRGNLVPAWPQDVLRILEPCSSTPLAGRSMGSCEPLRNLDELSRPMPWPIPAKVPSWSAWKARSMCRDDRRAQSETP